MVDWIKLIISPSSLDIPTNDHHKFQIFAVVSCDLLWHYCNKAYHDALFFDAIQVSRHINKIAMEHFVAWHNVSPPMERWLPLICVGYKINFDSAIRDTFSAQAAVCRNHKGLISMISQISPPYLPNYGEALVANLAFSLAISLNLQNFIIEGDSQVVILSTTPPEYD
jgi:hypothetical protein